MVIITFEENAESVSPIAFSTEPVCPHVTHVRCTKTVQDRPIMWTYVGHQCAVKISLPDFRLMKWDLLINSLILINFN